MGAGASTSRRGERERERGPRSRGAATVWPGGERGDLLGTAEGTTEATAELPLPAPGSAGGGPPMGEEEEGGGGERGHVEEKESSVPAVGPRETSKNFSTCPLVRPRPVGAGRGRSC